ncbi:MAG: AAA family ATPase [Candidatus Doudnabacteria bacterium]|nr:AAA family ATPase [Candidatus Doudnabacteria bacterium]
MTVDELYSSIATSKPRVVYLNGKTSTGKSTFARKIAADFGYEVINLDDIVVQSVLVPRDLANQRSTVFLEVYKHRNKLDWIADFIRAAREIIDQHTQVGTPVVIDGAIAHVETMQDFLQPYADVYIAYFHPSNLELYSRYLTERFMGTTINNHNGLPKAFWELVDTTEFATFSETRTLTPSLRSSIAAYAQSSQTSSLDRIATLNHAFPTMTIVNI